MSLVFVATSIFSFPTTFWGDGLCLAQSVELCESWYLCQCHCHGDQCQMRMAVLWFRSLQVRCKTGESDAVLQWVGCGRFWWNASPSAGLRSWSHQGGQFSVALLKPPCHDTGGLSCFLLLGDSCSGQIVVHSLHAPECCNRANITSMMCAFGPFCLQQASAMCL